MSLYTSTLYSVPCNLCIPIVCWRGPVYSDTVACCLSDGHIGWWVGFWNGKHRNHVGYILYATGLNANYITTCNWYTCYLQMLRAIIHLSLILWLSAHSATGPYVPQFVLLYCTVL